MHGVSRNRRSCTDTSRLHFSFQFSPTSSCADSNNGVSAITSDRLQFDIITYPGIEVKNTQITKQNDVSDEI
jgi:hypothetical protein